MKPVNIAGRTHHVLICLNARTHEAMPCCAKGQATEIYNYFRQWAVQNNRLSDVWITPTGCLGWCHRDGVTVVIYPEDIWLRAVTIRDCDEIIQKYLMP